jgi:hypothetical protein
MAYLTLTNLVLSDAQQASLSSYVDNQVTATNTDGIRISVYRSGVADTDGNPLVLTQRSWKDSTSANAYLDYINTLGGTVVYAQVVAPL